MEHYLSLLICDVNISYLRCYADDLSNILSDNDDVSGFKDYNLDFNREQ